MNVDRLTESVKEHEGYRELPYFDTVNILTVGYGHNCDAMVCPPQIPIGDFFRDVLANKDQHEVWLAQDVNQCVEDAKAFCGAVTWSNLTSDQQEVVAEMAYQMGLSRLLGFRMFKQALASRDMPKARHEMLDSRWATQTPGRARELANKFMAGS